MDIFYYRSDPENFGDVLNRAIWPHFIGGIEKYNSETLFLGIGTVLSQGILAGCTDRYKKIVVFGSGAGYGALPNFDDRWEFSFVRGPRTSERIGIQGLPYITDPAVLVQQMYDVPNIKKTKISYMPHHCSKMHYDWGEICDLCDFHYIDPAENIENVINSIASTELLIAEAMHGAIVADALRVPWIPVKCYDHILDFKWMDWADTVNLIYKPRNVVPLYRNLDGDDSATLLKTKVKRGLKSLGVWGDDWWPLPPQKSTKPTINKACEQLLEIAKGPFFLSSDFVNSMNLQRVVEEIIKFEKKLRG